MQDYQHVLLATDLSEDSEAVAKRALFIATRANARFSIAHIIEPTPMMYGGGEFAIPLDVGLEETLQQEIQKKLAEQASRLGISAEYQYIRNGATKETLIELVNELKVDLLVLGSHDQKGLALLLGSTANALLHAMPCDILAVRV
ncbi:MAG: universal stress protein [Gammaproteobacteria bacterium]|jgi:universal stress protein A|nr:universal stress protein [Gammaproteobacteria bacterium]